MTGIPRFVAEVGVLDLVKEISAWPKAWRTEDRKSSKDGSLAKRMAKYSYVQVVKTVNFQ